MNVVYYTCEVCGGTFKSDGIHDPEKELMDNFGQKYDPEKHGLVCDDCAKKVMEFIGKQN